MAAAIVLIMVQEPLIEVSLVHRRKNNIHGNKYHVLKCISNMCGNKSGVYSQRSSIIGESPPQKQKRSVFLYESIINSQSVLEFTRCPATTLCFIYDIKTPRKRVFITQYLGKNKNGGTVHIQVLGIRKI